MVPGVVLASTVMMFAPQTRAKPGIDVEYDPSALLFRGFSAVVAAGPRRARRWRLAVDVFTVEWPRFDLDDGWRARGYGGSVFTRFHFWGAPDRLWISAGCEWARGDTHTTPPVAATPCSR